MKNDVARTLAKIIGWRESRRILRQVRDTARVAAAKAAKCEDELCLQAFNQNASKEQENENEK